MFSVYFRGRDNLDSLPQPTVDRTDTPPRRPSADTSNEEEEGKRETEKEKGKEKIIEKEEPGIKEIEKEKEKEKEDVTGENRRKGSYRQKAKPKVIRGDSMNWLIFFFPPLQNYVIYLTSNTMHCRLIDDENVMTKEEPMQDGELVVRFFGMKDSDSTLEIAANVSRGLA